MRFTSPPHRERERVVGLVSRRLSPTRGTGSAARVRLGGNLAG